MSSTRRKGRGPPRECTPPPPDIGQQLGSILNRLIALEERSGSEASSAVAIAAPASQASQACSEAGASTPLSEPRGLHEPPAPVVAAPAGAPATPLLSNSVATPVPVDDVAERLVNAISALNTVRPNQYYVSDFDPAIHDIKVWCDEVDRAVLRNRWDDHECLARIGNCLKGEARSWLSQWVHTERTWSNFKQELSSLCPRHVDVANILFDVMCTNSDKYSTYAEYARRSLLRLRVVRGLSDDLLSAIIVRGIADPQIRASATNAKLKPENIVEFLSIYVKPMTTCDF